MTRISLLVLLSMAALLSGCTDMPPAAATTTTTATRTSTVEAPARTALPTARTTSSTPPPPSPTTTPPRTPMATPAPRSTALPTPPIAPREWSADAVFTNLGGVNTACKPNTPGGPQFPLEPTTPAEVVCITTAIRALGGSVSAADFFEQYHWFLGSFEERGRIDSGFVSAPWFNMGRPWPVLLSGKPAFRAFDDLLPKNWKSDPSNASVAASGASVWSEYATLVSARAAPSNEQTLVLDFPLRTCRACANTGHLRLEVVFDADSVLRSSRFLEPVR